ncbi:hypoxanthine phosphoribosyltransferase [Dehalogenimonas alkenigignens]|uniref:hypoxanthine phosphoribosyltransferase n=1 Tax=Dehalogenimonas alkenigignens TaxID=1217799 RepID=UPI000D565D48|nr:hypoxanthine phosphoribosyltransferase [Dehalogenimonas alkenigignens]PVV84865.1 hypoxanthine phosphoribosyltransferase [Dehalogenimonas alkenigignens]
MTGRFDLRLLYSREDIAAVVRALAARIAADYAGKDLLVIGVLKGAVIFLADLIRELTIPVEIDFIGLSSYGDGVTSCGEVEVTAFPAAPIEGRHVLVVEDIVDTGLCLDALLKFLAARSPASVRVCALMVKPARHRVGVEIAYAGFAIPDKFVVGYGLDFAQRYRHLPQIYTLEEAPVEGQLASDD